jgi:hypothetical protein
MRLRGAGVEQVPLKEYEVLDGKQYRAEWLCQPLCQKSVNKGHQVNESNSHLLIGTCESLFHIGSYDKVISL